MALSQLFKVALEKSDSHQMVALVGVGTQEDLGYNSSF